MSLVPNLAELYLTDGSIYINLLSKMNGFALQDWQPVTPSPKDDGVWQDSKLSAGRRLVSRQLSNTIDSFTLAGRGGTADLLIFESQRIRRMLENSITYWTSEWQADPVYLLARGINESNVRYALIYDYRAPGDGNPFLSPFTGPDAAIFDEWPLIIEHDAWRDVPPGQSGCVELTGGQAIDTQKSFYPTTSLDDVYVISALFNNTELQFGTTGGVSTHTGIRFRALTIPPGSTITRAFMKLQSPGLRSSEGMSLAFYGEKDTAPAIFSTFGNFNIRVLTTANIPWGEVPNFGAGETIVTPDVTPIIQEIIDLPGWVSGNDLVLFIRNNGSDANSLRAAASFNSTIYTEPELVIVYDAPDLLGREATCLPEVYLANKRTEQNITDVYHFDASTLTFSPNIMTAALPTALYPTVPAAGDILYIMLDSAVAGSLVPFASVVWDILDVQTGITGVAYEYWNGAWVALPIQDNTAVGGIPFSIAGVNGMHWRQPVDWTFNTINGVTGFMMRIRITSVSSPTPPTQQNRAPYSVTWPNVDIDSEQVGGDLPALARHKIFTQSATSATLDLCNQRTLVGLRSTNRGNNFTSMLNWSDVQNPPGVTGSIGSSPNAAIVGDARSPTGRAFEYAVSGADPMTDVGIIQLSNTISSHFYGRFRAFLRLTVDVGTADDIGLQLSYANSETEIVYLPFIDEWLLVDMGQIVIPGTSILSNTDIYNSFFFTVSVVHDDDVDIKFYDLVLIPIDEWSGDFAVSVKTSANAISVTRYLDADSIFYPKASTPVRAIQRDVSDNDVVSIWQSITAQAAILQANADQQLFLLTATLDAASDKVQSFGYVAHKIQTEKVQRYLSMRGSR